VGCVGIVHAIELAEETLAAWAEVLGDYEILQPFDQLARAIFEMTAEELASNDFNRFSGPKVHYGKYLGLEKRGWVRDSPQDAGISAGLCRTLADGRTIFIALQDGLWTGSIAETPDQPIEGVYIHSGPR